MEVGVEVGNEVGETLMTYSEQKNRECTLTKLGKILCEATNCTNIPGYCGFESGNNAKAKSCGPNQS